MRSIFVPLLASVSIGCAANQTAVAAPADPSSPSREFATLQSRSDEQARRINELEARLGMVEAGARELRAALQQRETARPDVIRIGAARAIRGEPETAELDSAQAEPVEPAPARSNERRPLLRSINESAHSARAPLVLPVAPPGVPDRLPVVPLPGGSVAAIPVAPAAPIASTVERAREEYRAALTLVRSGDFDAALTALTEFLSKYPDQEFTDRAMFWRAEAFYAKRDYERALAEFEALSARFPRSEKAADAMLKIGMCHQRLGDEQRAQGFFRRVVDQFPESAAARAASKEGA